MGVVNTSYFSMCANMSVSPEYLDSPPPKIEKVKDESSDEEDDLPPLPSSLGTPQKPMIDSLQTNQASCSVSYLTAPSHTLSPLSISPNKIVSLKKDKEENVKQSDLLDKLHSKIARISKRQEIDDKVTDLITRKGGIMSILRQAETDVSSTTDNELDDSHSNNSSDNVFIPYETEINLPPGLPFFVRPPDLKAEIGFPSIEDESMSISFQTIVNGLYNITNFAIGRQLVFLFGSKPCPKSVILWLLDVCCLSETLDVRHIAYTTLVQLTSRCESISSPITTKDITTLLSKLGAVEIRTVDKTVYFPSPQNRDLILNSVCYVCEIVSMIFNLFPSEHCDVLLVKELTLLLLRIALDPVVCWSKRCFDVVQCLKSVTDVISIEDWTALQDEIIVEYVHIVDNYQNRMHLVEMLSTSSPRLNTLQHRMAKQFLMNITNTLELNSTINAEFAICVVSHYLQKKTDNINYIELHCCMKMLSIVLKSPEMCWINADRKNAFVLHLSHLVTKIKDNIPGLALQRGPVKDFMIWMKLELQQEDDYSGGLKQMNMFDYCVNDSQ